ncbi:hypothetical protein ACHAAC_08385 [Aeromicrobium sp. CF4.19]|uniref:hypothetical protein n=1 Tax=Aeromicrobium sp. CF4.19 TaxID=3373082 RepID=UPI003EE50C52
MKTVKVSRAECVSRLSDAEALFSQGLETRDLQGDEPASVRASVSSFVLAGIAGADVVCGLALGERASGGNHAEAVKLLGGVQGAEGLKKDLTLLVQNKTKAQYAAGAISVSTRGRVERAAERLLEAARSAIRR